MKSIIVSQFFMNIGFLLCTVNTIAASDCQLTTNSEKSPLVLVSGKYEFIYPQNGETNLIFASGEALKLVCPGNQVIVGSSTYRNVATAECLSDNTLRVNGENIKWNNIRCSSPVQRIAELTGNRCENNGKEVEIGFDVDDLFLRVILICFDETTQQALYTRANITASINQRTKNTPRPTWLQTTDIFNIKSPNTYYSRTSQRNTVNSLLGLPKNSTKYIQNNNYYLSRGHMTARSDNFYPAQQNVTFFLLNVAPQWQTCNEGNWEAVEFYVRNYAEANNVDLIEWTGVYGVTTLPHSETGESINLYLYNKDNKNSLPIPEFYWKVAYEPISQRAVVFIVLNNPYLKTYEPICDDISEKIDWIKWHKDDQNKGFGYVCTIEDFRKMVDFLPKFLVKDILT